jgi:hypothetical protein
MTSSLAWLESGVVGPIAPVLVLIEVTFKLCCELPSNMYSPLVAGVGVGVGLPLPLPPQPMDTVAARTRIAGMRYFI